MKHTLFGGPLAVVEPQVLALPSLSPSPMRSSSFACVCGMRELLLRQAGYKLQALRLQLPTPLGRGSCSRHGSGFGKLGLLWSRIGFPGVSSHAAEQHALCARGSVAFLPVAFLLFTHRISDC